MGKDEDKAIWRYFRNHWNNLFPNLGARSGVVKKSADLSIVISNQLSAFNDSIQMIRK